MASRQPAIESPKEQTELPLGTTTSRIVYRPSTCILFIHTHTHTYKQCKWGLLQSWKHKHFQSRVKYSNKYYKYALWLWLWLWLWHWQAETRRQLTEITYTPGVLAFIAVWGTYSHGRIRNLRNCFICLHVFDVVFSQFRFFRGFSHNSLLLLVVWFKQAINTQGKDTQSRFYKHVTSWVVIHYKPSALHIFHKGFQYLLIIFYQCLQTRLTFPVAVAPSRGMCCMYGCLCVCVWLALFIMMPKKNDVYLWNLQYLFCIRICQIVCNFFVVKYLVCVVDLFCLFTSRVRFHKRVFIFIYLVTLSSPVQICELY